MIIKTIFDKKSINPGLHIGWGVSFLVDDKILFDTGEKGLWLLENIRVLGVDINRIEAIVISHDHWDHWGGLWDLLRQKNRMRVYICPNFSREFKEKALAAGAQLIEAGQAAPLGQDIYTTGEVPGAYHGKYVAEQALALKTKNGLTVIAGCAHPGILKMVQKAKEKFPDEPLYLVLGGFHLMELDKRAVEIIAENFKKAGVMKAGPTHCCGEVAEGIFKKYYKDGFISVTAGGKMEV